VGPYVKNREQSESVMSMTTREEKEIVVYRVNVVVQDFSSDSLTVVDLTVLDAAGLGADTFAQAAIPVVFHVEDPGPSPLVRAGERLDRLGVAIDSLVRFGVRERLATDDILGPGCTLPPPAAARTLALAVVSDFHLVWPNLAA
jgi:hypothetical protein